MRLPKLFSWRLRRRPTGRGPNDTNTLDGSPSIERLSVLIQSLKLLEKVADAANIPYLKGAIGTALVIAECARVGDNEVPLGFLTLRLGIQIHQ